MANRYEKVVGSMELELDDNDPEIHEDPLSSSNLALHRRCPFPIPQVQGNHFLVYGSFRKHSRFPRLCLLGPDWFCSFVTILLISIPTIYFIITTLPSTQSLFAGLYALSGVTVLVAFMVTAFSDPGIVPRQSRAYLEREIERGNYPKDGSLCDICNTYRPERARHCFDCNACIKGHDHHCPWTGKCIGEGNIYWFHGFVITLGLHIFGTIVYYQISHKV